MDRNAEVEHLRQADAHIEKAERAVTHQEDILLELKKDSHDTRQAEQQLRDFQRVLVTMRAHREIIRKTIEQIDAGLI